MIGNIKYINSLGGIVEFDCDSGIIISKSSGMTENHVKLSTSQGFNQIGETVQRTLVQGKPIVFDGAIVGDATERAALMLNTFIPGMLGKLIYNDEWEIDVSTIQTPYIEQYVYNPRFQIELRAPYPNWSNMEETVTSLTGIEPMFSFPWDLTQPYIFGKRIERQFTNVHNSGNVDIPYTVIFTATSDGVTNPKITNAETYEYLQVKRTMSYGETITVTVKQDELLVLSRTGDLTTDVIGWFDIRSDLYRLHPGDNIIAHDADSGKDYLDITILSRTERGWMRIR